MRRHDSEEQVTFDTGAKRSAIGERFDLICPTGLRRIAKRYALGARKYTDYNWCEGLPINACLNHLIRHINDYMVNGNQNDDNLAAIAWNAIAMMHYEENCQHHKAPWVEADEEDKE